MRPVPPEYIEMMARDGHHNPPAFLHALSEMFDGVDFSGKRVLEIGSGRGLLAIYMGLQGAGAVVSMEPELVGATSGVVSDQRDRIKRLGLANVEVLIADFNAWEPAGARFDIIVSRASINHLYASERHVNDDTEAYEAYLRVARRIHGMLAPQGRFIATDACRYGFFMFASAVGVRRPWRPQKSGVNWRHHQNPQTWSRILKDGGFSRVGIDYPVPFRLKPVAALANTAVANFFMKGSFIIRADA